jgi:hypothetical protein
MGQTPRPTWRYILPIVVILALIWFLEFAPLIFNLPTVR